MTKITCKALTADPDRHSPVSGIRCRGCGANARMCPPAEVWVIARMAAWCMECAKEEFGADKFDWTVEEILEREG